jgi:hypothetical protein
VGFGEGFEDRANGTCTAGDIVAFTTGVHDAEAVLLVGVVWYPLVFGLWDITRRIKANVVGSSIKLVPVEVEEFKKQLAMLLVSLRWTMLKEAYNQTDDRVATESASSNIIQRTHHKELLDYGSEDGKSRILPLPMMIHFHNVGAC